LAPSIEIRNVDHAICLRNWFERASQARTTIEVILATKGVGPGRPLRAEDVKFEDMRKEKRKRYP
jgi:hypothetical protein